MAKRSWWPGSRGDQMTLMQNFNVKIGTHQAALGWTPAQVLAAQKLCEAFIGAFNFSEQSRTTMQAVTQWRDMVFFGEPRGTPAPDPPIFAFGGSPEYARGVVGSFFTLRDQIVVNTGYTTAIGEDLGIVGAEISPLNPLIVTPNLKAVVSMGNQVNITGSMQGMDALRVEYAPKGGSFTTVAFLTNTPGGFGLTPQNPNIPETGVIRAVFIKKNAEFGNFSPNYPVTVT